MRITAIQLQNFKRFTNLTIKNIPETSKLVLLIGNNGCGKSSIFDAFNFWSIKNGSGLAEQGTNYYKKDFSNRLELTDDPFVSIDFLGSNSKNNDLVEYTSLAKRFFGRTSIRIVPFIQNVDKTDAIKNNSDAANIFIKPDERFHNDVYSYVQEIDNALRKPLFKGENPDLSVIRKQFIEPFNQSLARIFGEDLKKVIQIADFRSPEMGAPTELIFKKGDAHISYNLLSHGEKQVVILLLNFIVRQKYYEGALIYIDEMDCHLNTALQYNLLSEIVETWIPENAQIWTASHALGFIEYANQSPKASIIDFDNLDFDETQVLLPVPKSNLEVYDIAIPKNMLFEVLKGKRIIACENLNDELYNLTAIKGVIFVGLKDARSLFLNVKSQEKFWGLRDRDFLTDIEIGLLEEKFPKLKILRYYDFENYLYHPENIDELKIQNFNKESYLEEILRQKEEKKFGITAKIESSRKTYEEFKKDLKLDETSSEIIAKELNSQDFETFYKYFDMKEKFDKSVIAHLNIPKDKLVQTKWFKNQIESILND